MWFPSCSPDAEAARRHDWMAGTRPAWTEQLDESIA